MATWLPADCFRRVIVPAIGTWSWLGRWFPEEALLAPCRAFFFYGSARFTFWLIWTQRHDYCEWDLSRGAALSGSRLGSS